MISVLSGLVDCIPHYIGTYITFNIQQWGLRGGGRGDPRFRDFPPGYFQRTFYVIEDSVRCVKQVKLLLLQFV